MRKKHFLIVWENAEKNAKINLTANVFLNFRHLMSISHKSRKSLL